MFENEICIYCHKNTSNTIGIEHVIPESLGFKETLPKGYVCDECNNYFANIDNVILHNRFIALQVGIEQIPGKKDKIRREIGNKLSFPEKGHFSLTSDTLNIPSGKLKESYEFKFSQDKVFNEIEFARGIHKIAFNLYAFDRGRRASLNQKFDNLRRYIRNPDKKEFWKYAVKYYPNSNNRFIRKNIVVFNIYDIEFMVSLVKDLDEKIAINNGYKILHTDNEWNHNSLFGLKDE